MSKPSTIGLTPSGRGEPWSVIPAPTEEERKKLRKSAERLVGRHGWWAFAEELASVCEGGANCWHTAPQSAALWQHRADIVRGLARREETQRLPPATPCPG